jgi:hypothetical protein
MHSTVCASGLMRATFLLYIFFITLTAKAKTGNTLTHSLCVGKLILIYLVKKFTLLWGLTAPQTWVLGFVCCLLDIWDPLTNQAIHYLLLYLIQQFKAFCTERAPDI